MNRTESIATACQTVHGFMPFIYHPNRADYLQIERYPRKTKATAAEAAAYAEAVLTMRAALRKGRQS